MSRIQRTGVAREARGYSEGARHRSARICARPVWFRPTLVTLAAMLGCGSLSGAASAAEFDCGLSSDRVSSAIDELRKDSSDFEAVGTEIAASAGRIQGAQDAPERSAKQHVAAYIRKMMPGKLAALVKEARLARLRGCLTDAQADEIVARGTSLADKVLDPPT